MLQVAWWMLMLKMIVSRLNNDIIKIDIINSLVGDFIKEYDNSNYDFYLNHLQGVDTTEQATPLQVRTLYQGEQA